MSNPLYLRVSQSQELLLADLVDDIAAMIQRYIALPDPSLAVLMACWIANTYTYQHFQYCGYLALRSATPRCGKSRLLRLVGCFSKGAPKSTTFPTAAVLFRSQDEVLLLDEVDALGNRDKRTHSELLAILNQGFERDGNVKRTEKRFSKTKEGFEPVSYGVYGPKAFAGIESLADTLADRTFQIPMQRSPQRMEPLRERELEHRFKQIRDGLEAWAETHSEQIDSVYAALRMVPELADMDDRLQDISEPLVVLASLADAERPAGQPVLPRLYTGLRFAAGRREPSGRERSILAILQVAERLLSNKEKCFISTEDLLAECRKHPDLGYLENGRGLAGLLKHFDLAPGSNSHERGYTITRTWLVDWQSRYQPRTDGSDGFDGKMRSKESASLFSSSSTTYSTNPPLIPSSDLVSNLSVASADQGEDDLDDEF